LESMEDIESEVSVRSQSSVYRATRRIHGSKTEFTTFARRVQFAFEIPTGLAPTFETSSGISFPPYTLAYILVCHHWSLRLEFLTSLFPEPDPEGGEEPIRQPPLDLLQLVDKDDRASTYMATETLFCESFDCHVPVIVLPTNQEIPEDRIGLTGFAV